MKIQISKERFIGDGYPCYIITEVGINHNGSVEIAKQMIDEIVKTGADAVKFQKRTIDEMYTKEFLDKPYQKYYAFGSTYGEHKRKLEFSDEQLMELKEYASKYKIDFLVSGFDFTSFDFIENKINVPIHKIASPFVTNYPLLKKVAQYGKPIILSTGLHNFDEVAKAVTFIKKFNENIILFQATTLYPCPDELVNLNVMKTFRENLNVLVGYSSHDKGIILPVAAVAIGACAIEKHYTLDRTMKGPDHSSSVESRGMELIVKYTRSVERGLGSFNKIIPEEEKEQRIKYGVSVVSKANIKAGTLLTEEMLTIKTPGGGISPANFYNLIGKKVNRDITKDQILYDNFIE